VAKEEKARKKGLSEEELNALVDVELCETETLTLIYIPAIIVPHDTEENGAYQTVVKDNKAYDELINNKTFRADNYTQRGSQTINLGQKPREVQYQGFKQVNSELQVNNFDIVDAASQDPITET
jgi:hypothetical protein